MGEKIGHAEVRIGDTRLMVMDENPEWGANAPKTLGGATGSFMIYVPDADAAIERAVQAGATVVHPVEDRFWGDRTGTVVDPFGHKWMLGTQFEDVSPAEMEKRGKEWAARHADDSGAMMTSTARSAATPAKKAAKKASH